MPVRNIPKNHRSVTGFVASRVNANQVAFESTLERDFMLLVEFDQDVLSYKEQPVRIDYLSADGQARHYTPDILVTYRQTSTSTTSRPPLLVEIKYRSDLFAGWRELKPKFRAARRYATEHSWIFKIITEVEIRTPYLKNVKFLRQFQHRSVDPADANLLLQKVSDLRSTDPESLLSAICPEVHSRAQFLPTLWQLIARRAIGADLNCPLTMQSPIWPIMAAMNEEQE
jgi:TnsA endonuclease N terminal/TnsA endonuclease C terminal